MRRADLSSGDATAQDRPAWPAFGLFREAMSRRRTDLPLDQPMGDRRVRAGVQRAEAFPDFGIGVGHALIVADVFHPGRALVPFDPEIRVGKVAQQRPLTRTVTPANPPALGHDAEECVHILVPDEIFDRDDDGATARLDVDCNLRLPPAAEWIQIERRQRGQRGANTQRGTDDEIGRASCRERV